MLKISQCRSVLTFALGSLIVAAPIACSGGSPAPATTVATTASYAQEASQGIAAMQTNWYSQSSGLYAAPSGWWNAANTITVLANYSKATGSSQYASVLANTFANANKANGTANFINSYNDDEGWWALAWIDSYDLTGTASYLTMAQSIFADMAGQWDTTTCGGGIWWSKKGGGTYKNAIANELFLSVAASLANRVSDPTQKAQYLAWAQKEWQWFKATGMINSQNLVNDGLTSTNPNACTNNGNRTWSYNQGVILGGLVELYNADKDATLLPQAQAIAGAAIASLAPNGILADPTVSGGDAPQFKGVFTRNLMYLYAAAPNAQYKTFVDANANSIWTNDRGGSYEFGGLWQGPFDSGDATRQTSALDTLVAAANMQ